MGSTGYFDTFRNLPFPTMYDSDKTPVTVDIVEAGIGYAFIILLVSFVFILPGVRVKEVEF